MSWPASILVALLSAVALLPSAPDALLIRAATADESDPVYLLVAADRHGGDRASAR